MKFLNKVFFICLTILSLSSWAQAQNLLSCQNMEFESSLPLKDRTYFENDERLHRLREAVVQSVNVIENFQTERAAEIREATSSLDQSSPETRQMMHDFGEFSSHFRVTMALGFRTPYQADPIYRDVSHMVNRNLDLQMFRALPFSQAEPLNDDEMEKAVDTLRDFFNLEIRMFEVQLERQARDHDRMHPSQRLLRELQQAESLEDKLVIQNRTFRHVIEEALRRFRQQQREMALMALFHVPPVAYTSQSADVPLSRYLEAVDQVIANGDQEVTHIKEELHSWLSESAFNSFILSLRRGRANNDQYLIGNQLKKLSLLFEYIPALEQALIDNPEQCEVAERALAIHFKRMRNQQIAAMVLFVGSLVVAPMLSGAVLMTAVGIAGTGYSLYALSEANNRYRQLVDQALTELYHEDIDPQLMADLQALEAEMVAHTIMLPTMLPVLGFGVRAMSSAIRPAQFMQRLAR